MDVRTLCDIPIQLLAELRRSDQLLYRSGGEWRAISTQEMCERIRLIALALRQLGVRRGDRLALLSENRPEWTATDYATLAAGAADVPIYPTLLPEQIAYILNDSGATAVVVSNAEQLGKVLEIRRKVPSLREVVVMDPPRTLPEGVRVWHDLGDIGGEVAARDPEAEGRELNVVGPDDLASIIYTSGTTGEPKGVMLTHGNFVHNVKACSAAVPFLPSDICLSFLPLSHVYERLVEYCYLFRGASIAYADSIEDVPRCLREVRPTIACGVPRVFEKLYQGVLDGGAALTPLRRAVFYWAMAVARRSASLAAPGGGNPFLRAERLLADRLVYESIREKLGGRMRFFVSGSAPLQRQIAEFFYGIGVSIVEGYGLTETSPVITVNRLDSICFGTVGRPVEGVEVRIEEDGEILTRSPSVMKGYYNNEAATREVLKDSWLCTGDIGRLDEHGCLVITDRKKEVLKTSGGKMIAPQAIENLLRADRFIAQAMIVGDRRRFISALIVPDFEQIRSYAELKGIPRASMPEVLGHPQIIDLFERRIARVNDRLARYERIKAFRVLDREFTVEAGEITPTLKVRRRIIEKRYRDRIEQMYAAPPPRRAAGGLA